MKSRSYRFCILPLKLTVSLRRQRQRLLTRRFFDMNMTKIRLTIFDLRYKPHTFPPFQQYTQTAEGALFSNMRNSPQISAPTSRSFYLVSYHVYSTYNNAHLAIIQSLLYQFKLQLSNKNRHYAHAVDSVIVARSTARLLPPSKELFPCHCHIMIFSRES